MDNSSLVSWLATSCCFPFALLFPFAYTFLSKDLCFLLPFWGYVSAFAGTGLADNFADFHLRSSFAAPSVELTFLLGILVADRARAGCLWAETHESLWEAGLPGCSSHHTRIFISGRQEDERSRRCEDRSKRSERYVEGASRSWKRHGNNFSPEALRRNTAGLTPLF